MSTIAITDPISSAALLAKRAREEGNDVVEIRTFDKHSEYYTRACDPSVPSRTVEYDGDDASALHELAGTDRILVGADSGVAITERLQLYRGELKNDPARIMARTDKVEQARAVRAAGLEVVPQSFFMLREETAALAFARRLGFPVVLKPRASGGTNNVRLAQDEVSFVGWFRVIGSAKSLYDRVNGGAIVMAYVDPRDAQEFVVDMVGFDGVHFVTDAWRYEKEALNETPAMYRAMHLLSAAEAIPYVAYTRKVIDALGHRAGAVHAELWRTEAGIRLVEVGFRLPGLITKLSAAATGRDQVQWTLDSGLWRPAPKVPILPTGSRHAAVVFLAATRDGVLRTDLPDFSCLRSLHSVSLKASRAGDHYSRTVDVGTMAGWVALLHNDSAVIAEDIAAVREMERRSFQ
jgi:biotin carboxylase